MAIASALALTGALDLRERDVASALVRVEEALGTRLDRGGLVRKRRSVGARTGRGTWARIEARRLEKITGQGWNGTECAAVLVGVSRPRWHAGVSWADLEAGLMWRADETDLVADAPIKPAGPLRIAPELTDGWWATLDSSLAALAGHSTTRVATPDTVAITQEHLTATLRKVFPALSAADSGIEEWRTAHADLNWANLTAPHCWVLDWGRAPRGLDAANLWVCSLAVPTLAARVHELRRNDLESRAGRLISLYLLSGRMRTDGPHREVARVEAERLLAGLPTERR
ncbi:MAG: hypothetical protein ACRDR6_14525 [Pseudonocardiaceae bacterium]